VCVIFLPNANVNTTIYFKGEQKFRIPVQSDMHSRHKEQIEKKTSKQKGRFCLHAKELQYFKLLRIEI
jgi:hypothetical protein